MGALLLVFAGACGGDDDASSTTGGSDGSSSTASDGAGGREPTDVDPDGQLVFGINFGVNSFDPHLTTFAGDQLWQRQVYDRLLTLGTDDDGKVTLEPQLATDYDVAEDGLSITFTLREGVTFHDGTPFDANAVKANIDRAIGPDSNVASRLASIESVEAMDARTVVFHLSQPDPAVLWLMAVNTPGMMASPAAFEQDLATKPVGTGPYELVSAEKDADVVYERNEDYWDPESAALSRLVIRSIADQNARYNAVRSGEIDAAFLSTPLDAESRALEDEGYHWVQALSPVEVGVLMNPEMAPFDDPRVRKAVYIAVDRAEVAEELTGGISPPVFQPFPEGYLGHDPDLEEPEHDPEAARALIEEAGATGAKVEIIQATTPPQDQLALVVQQALGEIGLDVELLPVSPTEARPMWAQGGHQAFVTPVIAQVDPGSTLTATYLGGDNPAAPPQELVQMAQEAAALPAGSDEQDEAYREISRYLVENPIHSPIFQYSTVVLARPDVVGAEGMIPTGIADLDFRGVGIAAS